LGELYDPEVRNPLTGAAPDSVDGLLFPSGSLLRGPSHAASQFSLSHSSPVPEHYRALQAPFEPGTRGGSGGSGVSGGGGSDMRWGVGAPSLLPPLGSRGDTGASHSDLEGGYQVGAPRVQ